MKDKKKAKIINILNKIKNADEYFINEDDKYIDPDFILESNGKAEEEFEQLMKKEKSIMDKKEALECIRNEEYESVPSEFYKDKSFVLEGVKLDRRALEFADESLKKDPDIIKAAKK